MFVCAVGVQGCAGYPQCVCKDIEMKRQKQGTIVDFWKRMKPSSSEGDGVDETGNALAPAVSHTKDNGGGGDGVALENEGVAGVVRSAADPGGESVAVGGDGANDHDVLPSLSLEKQWPTEWDKKQIKEFREKYEWLDAENGCLGCSLCVKVKSLGLMADERVSISVEWSTYKISAPDEERDRGKRLLALRRKINRHVNSEAHETAKNVNLTGEKQALEKAVQKHVNIAEETTAKVFRSVYQLAKLNRPFSDLPSLVELQKINGLNMGIILHSRYSATKIVDVIADVMRARIVQSLIKNSSKLSVLVDEAVNISKKATLVISIKGSVGSGDPQLLFLELVELDGQDAKTIAKAIVTSLHKAGFSDEYLKANWVAFIADGANVMLGKKGGVYVLLRSWFPRLVAWHCCNHRLELAVGDAVKCVTAINHFKAFLEELHNVYSYSAKNVIEILEISETLNTQVLSIGRILTVRWVASSFRTVHAVWNNYKALHAYFSQAAVDMTRSSSERSKFCGLKRRLESPEFVCDLGLMYDALQELSHLSKKLQARSVTLLEASELIKRTIRVIESFKSYPGGKYEEALRVAAQGKFNDVELLKNAKLTSINSGQFFQSLVDSLRARLVDTQDDASQVVSDMRVLNPETWPETPNIRHGEKEIERLCSRFNIDHVLTVDGMREYVDKKGKCKVPVNLEPLVRCMHTIPCGTAECERTFSLMNVIASDMRARLTVSNISNLIMISMNGPPLNVWNPEPYIREWLKRSHRTANDTRSRRSDLTSGKDIEDQEIKRSLWEIL